MPPKKKDKKGKNKDGDQDDGKTYTLITTEELRAREQKYVSMLSDIKDCKRFVDETWFKFAEKKEENRIKQKWIAYLKCDGMPKPYIPPETRTFFVKQKMTEVENVENTKDWLLYVDERSILTQDISRVDLTKKQLDKTIKPNFGKTYEIYVDLALKILKSIEDYLDNTSMVAKCTDRILEDIKEQKNAVQQEIQGLFNRYAYRILSSEPSYMTVISAIAADYFYAGKAFVCHIWGLRNVPMIFENMSEKFVNANLHKMKVNIVIPPSVLTENLTIRGIHMDFDHVSEHAVGYDDIVKPMGDLNAGISDFHECLLNEWAMQMDIIEEVRNQMRQKRLQYEEKMLAIEEANSKKPKEEDKDKNQKKAKSDKPKKPPKEPPVITDDVFPDIWDDFLYSEQKQYEDYMKIVYHPDVLKLKKGEINLKKYIIVGGIYQMLFVIKPVHYHFDSFNMTWHSNWGNLVINENVYTLDPFSDTEKDERTSIPRGSITESRKSSIGKGEFEEQVIATQLFVITFELPKHLCLWGEPLPCHFENDVIGYIEEELPPEPPPPTTAQSNLRHSSTQLTDAISNKLDAVSNVSISSTNSVAQAELDTMSVGSQGSRKDLARRGSRRPPLEMFDTFSILYLKDDDDEDDNISLIEVGDFYLNNQPLTKLQMRNLERHCIPLILSSYKFPGELKEDETEESRGKPKGQGGNLVRKRAHGEADGDINERVFTLDDRQDNPERIFPVYEEPETLAWPDNVSVAEDIKENEPETFFELIDTLDVIKTHRIELFDDIMEVPPLPETRKGGSKLKKDKRDTRSSSAFGSVDYKRKVSKRGSDSEKDSKRASTFSTRSVRKSSRGSRVNSARNSAARTSSDSNVSKVLKEKEATEATEAVRESKELDEEVIEEEPTIDELLPPKDTRKTYKYSRWTKEYIFHSTFDREQCQVTVWTDRLGTIGFAYKRYEHFPFKYWSVEPSEENPDTEVIFTIVTQYVKVVIFIRADGYRGYVTEPTKKFVRNRKMYLTFNEPLTELKELKQLFRDNNLNIFSEPDASFYIENGYFSEKHLAVELHTYTCIALHCAKMKFTSSDWNRLSKRREIVLNFMHSKDVEQSFLVRITPERSTFVDIKELCSEDLDVIKLEFTPTWRNIDYYADLNHLIISVYPDALENSSMETNLSYYLKSLLNAIRPLSNS